MHVPRGQIGRPGRAAARSLRRRAQVRRDTDRATHLVLHLTDLDADRAVSLPLPHSLAPTTFFLGLPRVRVLIGVPVLVAQAQNADLRRLRDRPRVRAAVYCHTLLARRDCGLDSLVGAVGGFLLLAGLMIEAARP